MAPADDHDQAAQLAGLSGARWGPIAHPLDAAAALDQLLEAQPTQGFPVTGPGLGSPVGPRHAAARSEAGLAEPAASVETQSAAT